MRLVDRPEIADFVLVDDFSGDEPRACRSSTPIRTVTLDADAPAAGRHGPALGRRQRADYTIYVHSVRFSQQDAAALLAAMWKTDQRRDRRLDRSLAVRPARLTSPSTIPAIARPSAR